MTPGTAARPLPGSPRPYQFPAFESTRLPNGVGIVVAPVPRLPLVSIRIIVDAGSAAEPLADAGVAALTAAALAEGTTRMDSATLAAEFERLGGALSTGSAWDATEVATTVLSEHFETAFGLLAEVIRTPALPEREIERLRHERLAELLELRTEPRGLADERFDGLLFKPGSRYSLPEDGAESSVSALTRTQCRAWHAARFLPSGTTVVVCGDVSVADAVRVVSAALADWSGTGITTPDVDDLPASTTRTVHLIRRTNAPQTELRIGHVGLRRSHPDYFDVVVMNAILGGVFNSRINLNLRERHAYTYGAFSSFDWRRDAGAFTVSTAVATDVTADATREILRELDRVRSDPPTDEELSLATSYLVGVFPIHFETTEAIAAALAMQRMLHLPDDYFDTYRERIRTVTAEGVMRAARAHVHVDALQVLAVGDSKTIRPGLEALGIGPVVDAPAD